MLPSEKVTISCNKFFWDKAALGIGWFCTSRERGVLSAGRPHSAPPLTPRPLAALSYQRSKGMPVGATGPGMCGDEYENVNGGVPVCTSYPIWQCSYSHIIVPLCLSSSCEAVPNTGTQHCRNCEYSNIDGVIDTLQLWALWITMVPKWPWE